VPAINSRIATNTARPVPFIIESPVWQPGGPP
jgi:hypothetical protein